MGAVELRSGCTFAEQQLPCPLAPHVVVPLSWNNTPAPAQQLQPGFNKGSAAPWSTSGGSSGPGSINWLMPFLKGKHTVLPVLGLLIVQDMLRHEMTDQVRT